MLLNKEIKTSIWCIDEIHDTSLSQAYVFSIGTSVLQVYVFANGTSLSQA